MEPIEGDNLVEPESEVVRLEGNELVPAFRPIPRTVKRALDGVHVLVSDKLAGVTTELRSPVLTIELGNTDEMRERDPEMVVLGPESPDLLHPILVWAFWGHVWLGLQLAPPLGRPFDERT